MERKMHQMTFRFPNEMKERLKKKADERGMTLTGIIKDIIWTYLESERK